MARLIKDDDDMKSFPRVLPGEPGGDAGLQGEQGQDDEYLRHGYFFVVLVQAHGHTPEGGAPFLCFLSAAPCAFSVYSA
jgi:hypothetical protein